MKGNNPIDRNRPLRLIKATLNLFLSFVLVVLLFGVFVQAVQAQSVVNIVEGDEWRYFRGVEDPPFKWNRIGFNDSSWQKGQPGFGYGGGNNRTLLGHMKGNYTTIYARREFTIDNPSSIKEMTMSVVCDGPFIAYLNGIEIKRNRIGMPVPDQAQGNGWLLQIDISGVAHELLRDINVLSIQCKNDDIYSDDFNFFPFF